MKNRMRIFVVLIAVLFISSCENKPSKNDIEKAIADSLPVFMEIDNLKIKAMERTGTEFEPNYSSRFIAKVKVLNSTYKKIDSIGGNVNTNVIRLVLPEDSSVEAFGKAISVLDKKKWHTKITELEFESNNTGQLIGKFENAVIEGSLEHGAANQKLKEWEHAKKEKVRILSEAFNGEWIGYYICGQGYTGLTLTISTRSQDMSATFIFYPTKENPNTKTGSYSLSGTFSKDGSFSLTPKKWITRPTGYGMVGLTGKMNGKTNEMNGKIKSRSCKSFRLHKTEE